MPERKPHTTDWAARSPSPRLSTPSATPLIDDPLVGRESRNPALRQWHTEQLDRLPGLKFMRTLWVCNVSGGPFEYVGHAPRQHAPVWRRRTSLLQIPHRGVRRRGGCSAGPDPRQRRAFRERERDEVLAAFAAHKGEVTEGYLATRD